MGDRTPRRRTHIPQKIDEITAIEMARKARIDPRVFSQVLRDENFDWHKRHGRWTVEMCSAEHKALHRVLSLISKGALTDWLAARMAYEKPMPLQVDRSALSPRWSWRMEVERIIDDIEQLQEMFEAPDIRPLSASDISAANRRHDEMLAHSPWFRLWQRYGICCRSWARLVPTV
jgi:hypothetical protein